MTYNFSAYCNRNEQDSKMIKHNQPLDNDQLAGSGGTRRKTLGGAILE